MAPHVAVTGPFTAVITMVRILCSAFRVLVFPAIAWAQSKVPVDVDHSGDDNVGRGIVYALKEGVRGSLRLLLTSDSLEVM